MAIWFTDWIPSPKSMTELNFRWLSMTCRGKWAVDCGLQISTTFGNAYLRCSVLLCLFVLWKKIIQPQIELGFQWIGCILMFVVSTAFRRVKVSKLNFTDCWYEVFFCFKTLQVNLNSILCPAVSDPFYGRWYRIWAIVHQSMYIVLHGKIYTYFALLVLPRKSLDIVTSNGYSKHD